MVLWPFRNDGLLISPPLGLMAKEKTMKALLVFAAVCFSVTAFAQDAPPKVGNKPLVQVRPKEPVGCKLVGSVKGTKLWAGDCTASELRGTTSAAELLRSFPPQATGAGGEEQ
jgi:hypothetical protein